MDSKSRTLTATSCFSVVLVHERQFKWGFWVAELVVKSRLPPQAGSFCLYARVTMWKVDKGFIDLTFLAFLGRFTRAGSGPNPKEITVRVERNRSQIRL